jgi:hypothetical protein
LTITFLVGGLGVEEQRMTLVKSQITPRDFFLWGRAKEKIYRTKPSTLDELEQQIRYTFSATH